MVTGKTNTPTKFVGAVLASLHKKHPKIKLPTDKILLHSIFYELGKTNDIIYQILEFNTRKAYPYSLNLDEAFSNIQASNSLRRHNPAMAEFEIQPSISSYKKSYDPAGLGNIDKIAGQLANSLP